MDRANTRQLISNGDNSIKQVELQLKSFRHQKNRFDISKHVEQTLFDHFVKTDARQIEFSFYHSQR